MRRTSVMTFGFVLIFLGIQLNLVQTYVLTPRVSDFLSEKSEQVQLQQPYGYGNPANQTGQNSAYNSPYYQASHGSAPVPSNALPLYTPNTDIASRSVTPPNWLCWPVLFLGTVVCLHGFSMRRNFN